MRRTYLPVYFMASFFIFQEQQHTTIEPPRITYHI